jgi:hypothetical protein
MSSAVPIRANERPSIADQLLLELDCAQKRFIESIADLADVTSTSSPDPIEYLCARVHISQAILARSSIFDMACEFLRGRVTPCQWEVVTELRVADSNVLMQSAQHVAEWTNERVESDWAAYCLASKNIRMMMGNVIERERALLYPLLESVTPQRVSLPADIRMASNITTGGGESRPMN